MDFNADELAVVADKARKRQSAEAKILAQKKNDERMSRLRAYLASPEYAMFKATTEQAVRDTAEKGGTLCSVKYSPTAANIVDNELSRMIKAAIHDWLNDLKFAVYCYSNHVEIKWS